MASVMPDSYEVVMEHAKMAERERCIWLINLRADITRASIAKLRKDGTYTERCIWPPFKKVTFVAPKWERAARDLEAFVRALEVLADFIRKGYDKDDVISSNKPPAVGCSE